MRITKQIKQLLKTHGINAKAKLCKGWELDAVYIHVAKDELKQAYSLTRELETATLTIIVQGA